MLKIKNNDIYLTRGENATVSLEVCNTDGTPFVLPPVKDRTLYAITTVTEVEDKTIYAFNTPLIAIDESVTFVTDKDGLLEIQVVYTSDAVSVVTARTVNCSVTLALTGIKGIVSIKADCKIVRVQFMHQDYYSDIENKPVSVLAFTVRASEYGAIVLEKYINLHSGIMRDGETDYSVYGWNKFTSQEIRSISPETDLFNFLRLNYNSFGDMEMGESDGNYYHLVRKLSGDYGLQPYIFAIDIPVSHEDTAKLQEGEYVYDAVVYQGYVKDISNFEKNEFPFKQVIWKQELIGQHKFIVGGSNNA